MVSLIGPALGNVAREALLDAAPLDFAFEPYSNEFSILLSKALHVFLGWA